MNAITADEKEAWAEAGKPDVVEDYTMPMYAQAALDAAVAAERERCAKLADEYATWGGSNFHAWFTKLAAAIRA